MSLQGAVRLRCAAGRGQGAYRPPGQWLGARRRVRVARGLAAGGEQRSEDAVVDLGVEDREPDAVGGQGVAVVVVAAGEGLDALVGVDGQQVLGGAVDRVPRPVGARLGGLPGVDRPVHAGVDQDGGSASAAIPTARHRRSQPDSTPPTPRCDAGSRRSTPRSGDSASSSPGPMASTEPPTSAGQPASGMRRGIPGPRQSGPAPENGKATCGRLESADLTGTTAAPFSISSPCRATRCLADSTTPAIRSGASFTGRPVSIVRPTETTRRCQRGTKTGIPLSATEIPGGQLLRLLRPAKPC
jgi:hypothetical protein